MQLCSLSIQTVLEKMKSSRKRLIKRNCGNVSSSIQLLRTQNQEKGSKSSTNYFFGIFANVCHILSGSDLIFLKSPWWPAWAIFAQYLLQGTILSSMFWLLLNVELFLVATLGGCFCEWFCIIYSFGPSSPRIAKILGVIKYS